MTKHSVKWTYNVGPPVDFDTFCVDNPPQMPEGILAREAVQVDPPLGPETDAFFAEVLDALQTLPPDAPVQENPSALCDLNRDGRCDATDFQLFQGTLGTCLEDYLTPADFRADVDGDGCVTPDDQEIFVSFDSDSDGILGFDDACPNSDLSPTVVIDSCDSEVPNTLLSNGCTISDRVHECTEKHSNRFQFRRCVVKVNLQLRRQGVISLRETIEILKCAVKAKIP